MNQIRKVSEVIGGSNRHWPANIFLGVAAKTNPWVSYRYT